MVKKVILTALIVLLSAGLLGCWFYFVGRLETRGRQESRCDRVSVVLLDSLESAIVDKDELRDYVAGLAIGRKTDSIDLDTIERAILSRGEVMTAQVFAYSTGELAVELTQRKPVVRFDNSKERFYSDPEGYIFPVTNAVNVPLVTGKIPLNISAGYKGHAPEENRDWVMGLVGLAGYIDSRDILKREIEQIDIAENGDIVVATIDGFEYEATVKTFYKEADHIRLQPENDTMSPILVKDCQVQGKVKGVFRYFN